VVGACRRPDATSGSSTTTSCSRGRARRPRRG
jgi:hypothetical protein